MSTLDQWIISHSLGRIDFIKLDVEGAEGQVLAGAWQTLKCFHPIVLFEFIPQNATRFGLQSRDQLVSLLEDLGYVVYRVTLDGELSADLDPPDIVTSNYCAIPHDKELIGMKQ